MRITDLYDLEEKPKVRKKIADGLIADIESIAKEYYKDDRFRKFIIKIRIEPINVFGDYK